MPHYDIVHTSGQFVQYCTRFSREIPCRFPTVFVVAVDPFAERRSLFAIAEIGFGRAAFRNMLLWFYRQTADNNIVWSVALCNLQGGK